LPAEGVHNNDIVVLILNILRNYRANNDIVVLILNILRNYIA
jgi:hypothetical protein